MTLEIYIPCTVIGVPGLHNWIVNAASRQSRLPLPQSGCNRGAHSHWERNPVALRPDQLLSLAQALNVSVDDLVGTKFRT